MTKRLVCWCNVCFTLVLGISLTFCCFCPGTDLWGHWHFWQKLTEAEVCLQLMLTATKRALNPEVKRAINQPTTWFSTWRWWHSYSNKTTHVKKKLKHYYVVYFFVGRGLLVVSEQPKNMIKQGSTTTCLKTFKDHPLNEQGLKSVGFEVFWDVRSLKFHDVMDMIGYGDVTTINISLHIHHFNGRKTVLAGGVSCHFALSYGGNGCELGERFTNTSNTRPIRLSDNHCSELGKVVSTLNLLNF